MTEPTIKPRTPAKKLRPKRKYAPTPKIHLNKIVRINDIKGRSGVHSSRKI